MAGLFHSAKVARFEGAQLSQLVENFVALKGHSFSCAVTIAE
jgi:hypothetical protein